MTNADRIRAMTDEELAVSIMCPAEYDLDFNNEADTLCCACKTGCNFKPILTLKNQK